MASLIPGRGTLAAYNGQGQNAAGSMATGTLTLATTAGGRLCTSHASAAGNVGTASGNSAECTDSSTGGSEGFSIGPLYPGVPVFENVAVENIGSLPASLNVYSADCTPDADATSACQAVEMYLQETSTLGGTAVTCWWPTAGTSCSFSGGNTADTFGVNGSYFDVFDELALGQLVAGATRYFTLGFELPTSGSPTNGTQGQSSEFSFTWRLEQWLPTS